MKKYRIGVWEEQSGYMEIEAKNEKEAEEKALEYIEENGVSYPKVDITNRQVYLV